MNHHFFSGGVDMAGKANSVFGFRYDREAQVRLDVDRSLAITPVVTDIINDNGNVIIVSGKRGWGVPAAAKVLQELE